MAAQTAAQHGPCDAASPPADEEEEAETARILAELTDAVRERLDDLERDRKSVV